MWSPSAVALVCLHRALARSACYFLICPPSFLSLHLSLLLLFLGKFSLVIQPSFMSNTPSIRLERLCAANERQLEFIDTATGPSHEPKFSVTATVGSLSATAEHLTKKGAKHIASNHLLQLIQQESKSKPGSWEQVDDILGDWSYDEELKAIKTKADESRQWRNLFNSVGALSEFCSKRKIPLPEYKDIILSDHPPLFKSVCIFNVLEDREGNPLITEAEASVKKVAKKKAADLMYESLQKNGHLDPTDTGDNEKKENDGGVSEKCKGDLENSSVNWRIVKPRIEYVGASKTLHLLCTFDK